MQHTPRHPVLTAALAAVVAMGVTACAESPIAPGQTGLVARSASTGGPTDPEPSVWDRTLWLCKVGTDATFEVSVDGGTPTERTVTDGECVAVFEQPAGIDENHLVTVTELSSLSYTLDSITTKTTRYGTILSEATLTGTASATAEITWTKGAIFTFYNSPQTPPPPPPSGGQGCTPGYWKQAQHFDSWVGYTPNTLFSDVFENAFPGRTLLQVLSQGGGGLTALGRHTVAALLNAASGGVAYDVATPAEVIARFNAVFPGGDYSGLKDTFEGFNEQGCPLN